MERSASEKRTMSEARDREVEDAEDRRLAADALRHLGAALNSAGKLLARLADEAERG